MRRTRQHMVQLLALMLLPCVCSRGSVTNLYRVLREQGVPFDMQAAGAGVLEAVVKAVDPWGRVLAEDETIDDAGNAVVRSEALPMGVAHIDVDELGRGAGLRVGETLQAWTGGTLRGVVLDLRGAGGSDLGSVDLVAGMVTGETNVIYTVVNGAGEVLARHAAEKVAALPAGFPVVVLTDGETAGAAELLGGVLKGRFGVLLMGGVTRGDPGLRAVLALDDSCRIHIATRWVVPVGMQNYRAKGITPDIVMANAVQEEPDPVPGEMDLRRVPGNVPEHTVRLLRRVGQDALLRRAVDVVLAHHALYRPGGDAGARDPGGSIEEAPVPAAGLEEESGK